MIVTQTSWTISVHPASRRTAASTTQTCLPAKKTKHFSYTKWGRSFFIICVNVNEISNYTKRVRKGKKLIQFYSTKINKSRFIQYLPLWLGWCCSSPDMQSQATQYLWGLLTAPAWKRASLVRHQTVQSAPSTNMQWCSPTSNFATLQSAETFILVIPGFQKPFFLMHVCWWIYFHSGDLKVTK